MSDKGHKDWHKPKVEKEEKEDPPKQTETGTVSPGVDKYGTGPAHKSFDELRKQR